MVDTHILWAHMFFCKTASEEYIELDTRIHLEWELW
jgi:hypothetical protein